MGSGAPFAVVRPQTIRDCGGGVGVRRLRMTGARGMPSISASPVVRLTPYGSASEIEVEALLPSFPSSTRQYEGMSSSPEQQSA